MVRSEKGSPAPQGASPKGAKSCCSVAGRGEDDSIIRQSHDQALGPMLSIESRSTARRAGEGLPRHNPGIADDQFIETFDDSIRTLCDTFDNAVKKYSSSTFLGWRPRAADGTVGPYHYLTYGEVNARVKSLAAGLATLGLPPKAKVGLYSINRPEWALAEYASYYNSFVTVPLYDTLGEEAILHICNQTEMAIIVASADRALNILRFAKALPTLKTIICMDDEVGDGLSKAAAAAGVVIITMTALEEAGASNASFVEVRPTAEDLFTICYTSGTTDLPKGVMLPHRAIVAEAGSILFLSKIGKDCTPDTPRRIFPLGPQVVHISYLPLAHVYERVVFTLLTSTGATIGFYQGDVLKIMDDLQELRPTVFVTVPRLLNRVYDKIMAGVEASSPLKKYLFNMAYRAKLATFRATGCYTHWLWDRLVFGSLRARLGGRVSAMLTGSAPVSPEVMDFLRICFSCEVYEGYGQTETCAASTVTTCGDWVSGQIGVPTPCNDVKLVDIPDMDYTSEDKPNSRGEICIRGPNCFVGYYKEEALTREALDADGWVHTGDVGEWDERGRLKIIDRKKNIFKLAQGEYVSPEKIENAICRNKYISQAFVEGNSLKATLVAIIVPDLDAVKAWARTNGVAFDEANGASLCGASEVRQLIIKEIAAFGRSGTNELKGFEIPRDVHLESEPFSVDNGILTSTMKLKRYQAKQRYASQIAAMYVNLQ